jgi:tetratricopeptide (TPR) repeat protein/uncharacterized caspase-like protein
MAKVALLIGVSEYGAGLEPLPAAAQDVAALERVLKDPEVGGFDQVETLVNPQAHQMQFAIESLFSGYSREDLALLYFSGHGIKDDSGNLYFAAPNTQKTARGTLIRASAVSAQFVHDVLTNSRVKRQAIILDCCFSGAFDPEFRRKDDGSVDLRGQLGAEGRVVLTSSSATEYSLERPDSDLSLYTRYLVEGFETGAADLNEDGQITAQELHEYATDRVQKAAPAMTPKMIVLRDLGFQVVLAQARIADPRLRYRREVVKCAEGDHIRPARQVLLARLRQQLGLSIEAAREIEAEVFRPYRERLANIQIYRDALFAEAAYHYPLDDDARGALTELQHSLGLELEDIAPLEAEVEAQLQKAPDAVSVGSAGAEPLEEAPEETAGLEDPFRFAVIPPAVELAEAAKAEPEELSVDLSNQEAQECLNRGNAKLDLKDNEGAIADYTEALRLDPQSTIAYYSRGLAKSFSGDNEGAIVDCDEALRLDQHLAIAYLVRGAAKSGDNEGAIADLNEAIRLNPNSSIAVSSHTGIKYDMKAYFLRAMLKHNLGDNEGMIADLNEAIRLDPNSATAYLFRGGAKSEFGDNKEGAIVDLNEAIRLDPNLVDAYGARAYIKSQLGDKEGAMADLDEAIRLAPNLGDAYVNRGNAKRDLGDNEGAIADYTEALRLDPSNANAYYKRGLSKYDLGQKGGAIVDYTEALRLDPNSGNAYWVRGDAKRELGNNEGAIADYTEALRLDPNNAGACYKRGLSKSNLGDNQGAVSDYLEAARLYQQQGNTVWFNNAMSASNQLQNGL